MRPTSHLAADSDPRPSWRVLLLLIPYLTEFRGRVIISFLLLIAAKVAGVALPWMLKLVVDDLDLQTQTAVAVPALLILAYGILRFA